MAFKMKGDPMVRNFGMGVSPMKQKITSTGSDPKLEKLKASRIANTKAGKIIKFGEGSNIIADGGLDSQGRNTWGDKVGKAKKVKVNKGLPKNFNTSGKDTWIKRSKEILSKGKEVIKKGAKKGIDLVKKKSSRTIPVVGTLLTAADLLTSKTATATKPVDHGASKKGSYTSDIQDIIPKKKEVKKTYPTRKFPTRKF